MSASLPPRPSLEWLRKLARRRLAQLRLTRPDARLADAQLAIAREYGFASWRRLKQHIDALAARATDGTDTAAADLLRRVGRGAVDEVRVMLDAAPALIDAIGPHPFWGGRPQALHVAVETGRPEMFALLLERGADVNGLNAEYDHWSPLMLAAERPWMRDELIRRGARVGLPEALLMADDAQVDALTRDVLPPGPVPNSGSWLALARTPFAIDRLLSLGVPIDLPDRWGRTPLDALSRLAGDGAKLARHLMARGAVASPAEYARLGDIDALARAARSDPTRVLDDNVMMAAVDARRYEVVEWLLGQGASANAHAPAPSHHSALHAAAWSGDMNITRLLIAAGADITDRDREHNGTPKDWAEVSVDVSGNPGCRTVAAHLRALEE